MSQDCPQLALDDIVHFMSPSPAPQSLFDDPDMHLHINSPSPEPLPESDVARMRRKVKDMRHVEKPDAQLTPREKELTEMVLRLTAMVRPDPDQLLRQADTISALVQQRDLLLHQAEEQRLQWNSEKDGWARMAEALLVQPGKNRINSNRDEDAERLHAAETDNKGLRQRLNETQSRLQVLESELTRLRPLLLMQPLISRLSMPPPTPNSKIQYARRRKKDAATTEDEEHAASEDEPSMDPFDTPSHTSHSQATPRAKSRKSDAPNSVHPILHSTKRRPQKGTSRGLSADARVEHLFLAARKIGKHRAGLMSGMMQQLERGRERRREESTMTAVATPKTPKRNTTHTSYASEGGYVYVGGQVRPGPGMQPVPLFFPTYPHHLLQTPSSSTTVPSVTSSAQKAKQDARMNNPPTPLDSLLSAARSMMHEDADAEVDEDEEEEVDVVGDSPGNPVGVRITRRRDTQGSPVPKRRKVLSRLDKLTASHDLTKMDMLTASVNASGVVNAGPSRVRSALDVLADQAAAFSTQEQSVALQIETQTKDKGKEKVDIRPQKPSSVAPRLRERRKSREGDAPSNVALTSRSRTPQLDSGDSSPSPAPSIAAGGPVSETPVDPGGTSSASTSDPSLSQILDSTSLSEWDLVAMSNEQRPRLSATLSQHTDDSGEVTPRQAPHAQGASSEGGTRATVAQPSFVPMPVSSIPENESRETPLLQQHSEVTTSGENDGSSGSGSGISIGPAKNKELTRVVDQDVPALIPPAKRPRSPYIKWSKEEDDLLAQAVAKYGQKWDLVQKALPSRGYHQVRQRWLRKLGVFDSKPDLSSFQTAATTISTMHGDSSEPRGNPKLGLAPLSSEKAFSGLVRKSSS